MALWTSLLAGSVVALALVVAWLLLQGKAKNSKLKAIPAPPKTHWLLGHPGVIDHEKAPWNIHNLAKQLGRIYRLRLAHLNIIVVTDPAETLRLTSRGEHYLDKAPDIYVNGFNMVHNDPKAYNLISWHTGPEWRAIRKATAPMFAGSHLKLALPLLLEVADSISQQWEAAGPNMTWDLNDICKRITLDTITGWGFDSRLNAIKDLTTPHPAIILVNDMFHAVHTVLADPVYKLKMWTSVVQKGLKAAADYDKWMTAFTEQLLQRQDGQLKDCIGRALIELDDPCFGGKLCAKQLVSNVAFFFAAGYETTANAMTMTLLLLLKHPEWLQRVEAELDTAGLLKTPARRQPRGLTSADLNELPVLNAVIKESLRLMPSAALGSFRLTKADTQICGYTVPAGCIVAFPPLAIDSARWSYGEDAEEFKPDRWLAKGASRWDEVLPSGQVEHSGSVRATAASAAATSMPGRPKEPYAFSTGPRDCIGQALGRMELQVFLAALLSRFRLHLAPSMGTPQQALDSLVFQVTITSANGVWVTAEAR